MTNERLGDPGRASDKTMPGRRGLLATLLALGTARLASTAKPTVVAKKKRKRCRKKNCPPPDPPQSCVGLCDPGCNFCYRRNAASNLCGGTLEPSAPCKPCATDNDCLGTNQPYGVSSQTTLSTGMSDALACLGNPPGICGKPASC